MEAFTAYSCFFSAYKLFSLYNAQGYLSVKDVLKFYMRKYLRLAPMYYFCFFVGWAIFPHMGAGPIWYSARAMYTDCSEYWWAHLLMIGNIVPYFQAPNYGCFFWGWVITTDLQLSILIPFFVIIYKKRAWVGHLVAFIAIVADNLGVAYVTNKYQLRAGPLAVENWYLFAYLFQKPFFKITAMFVGIIAAFFYMQILDYRKVESDEERS